MFVRSSSQYEPWGEKARVFRVYAISNDPDQLAMPLSLIMDFHISQYILQ